jgi:hypothetical protein
MLRLSIVAAFAVGMSVFPATATAESAAAPCNFRLSEPHVVDVSGTAMVTATMQPTSCDGGVPYQSVVCVQKQGSPGPGQCRQNNGMLTAQVYLSPYEPGATYVATGRGCAYSGNPPTGVCAPADEVSAAL